MGHTHEGLPATVVSNTLKGPLDCLNATVVRGDAVDVGAVLRRVYATLAQSGPLVFSVEHPIITSSDQAWQGREPRQAWLVDDYFVTGRRETEWMGSRVVKFHRTVEHYVSLIQSAGLRLETLREPAPAAQRFASQQEFRASAHSAVIAAFSDTRRVRLTLVLLHTR
jgi:hypothetical protein